MSRILSPFSFPLLKGIGSRGAVDGWDQLLRRAGMMSFKQVLQPAFEIADQGFPWSQRIARDVVDGSLSSRTQSVLTA